jgi:hypothetical protein
MAFNYKHPNFDFPETDFIPDTDTMENMLLSVISLVMIQVWE